VTKGLADKIRVADKVLPDLAGLTQKQIALFKGETPVVDFKQANLSREVMVNKVFETGFKIDYVINLAGETKYSQTEEVYKENIIDVSLTCGKAAAKAGVKRFIEVSSGQVYDSSKPANEDTKNKPWTKLATAKLQAEAELKKIPNLDVVIVRPAIVYGPGDITGITPRIICAAVYKHLGETMEFLWDKDLKMNTIHVEDVCAALHFLTTHGKSGDVFNLVDNGNTDQGTINKLLETIFKIKTGFMGNIKSKVATSVAMKTVAETANEKHLKPWSDLCKSKGIQNTPLTPYLDEELLYNDEVLLDGSKLNKLGFSISRASVTEQALRDTIAGFVTLGYFPANYI